MEKKGKPFWANNHNRKSQQKNQGITATSTAEVVVQYDPRTRQVQVRSNVEDQDRVVMLLIDALRAVQLQKLAQKKQDIVLAKPQIVLR